MFRTWGLCSILIKSNIFVGKWQETEKGDSSDGKASACNEGNLGSIPGLGRSLEKGKATHTSILAWRIPGTIQSMELQRVGHDWATFTSTYYYYISSTSDDQALDSGIWRPLSWRVYENENSWAPGKDSALQGEPRLFVFSSCPLMPLEFWGPCGRKKTTWAWSSLWTGHPTRKGARRNQAAGCAAPPELGWARGYLLDWWSLPSRPPVRQVRPHCRRPAHPEASRPGALSPPGPRFWDLAKRVRSCLTPSKGVHLCWWPLGLWWAQFSFFGSSSLPWVKVFWRNQIV